MDSSIVVKQIEIKLSEKGLSKTDFFEKTGITSATLSQWRRGVYSPSEKKLEAAAEFLGVSVAYLRGYEEKKKPLDDDQELEELLEELKNRPECRMLFQLAKDATAEEVRQAVKVIEALRR